MTDVVNPLVWNCCTECSGELRVKDDDDAFQSFHRAAWCILDVSPLWDDPNQRGANVVIPGVPGRAENPRRDDETDFLLRFAVNGVYDPDDTPTVLTEGEQLRQNLLYIRTNMLNPAAPLTARDAELISPDTLTTLTGRVQYGGNGDRPLVREYRGDGLWIGKLHLVVPAGTFT